MGTHPPAQTHTSEHAGLQGICGNGGCPSPPPLRGMERKAQVGMAYFLSGHSHQQALCMDPPDETEDKNDSHSALVLGSAPQDRGGGGQNERNAGTYQMPGTVLGIQHNDTHKELSGCSFCQLGTRGLEKPNPQQAELKIQAQVLSTRSQPHRQQAACADSLRRAGWCQAVLWAGSHMKHGPGWKGPWSPPDTLFAV